jgi:hypothetical protein
MAQEAVDVLPTTTSTAAAAATGGPEILRGSVAPPPPPIEPAAGPADRQLLAGDRLWLVDQKTRKLIGCRLVQTIYVDGLAIQCRERRLPRGGVAHR